MLRFGVGLALTIAMTGIALAAPMRTEDKAALQQQCSGDFTTFCGDMPPADSPETQACFDKNMSKLSPGCQNASRPTRRRARRLRLHARLSSRRKPATAVCWAG